MKIAHPPASGLADIRLRQLEPADCEAWYAYLSLSQVFERTSWNLRSIDDLRPVLAAHLQDDPASSIRLAVEESSTNRLVGTIGLHTISPVNRSAEIAYDFAPSHWGRGLASRLCGVVTRWSFESLGMHRVQGTVLVGNDRSVRVLERCGFRHEGLLRGFRMVRGRPGDFDLYARLATDPPLDDGAPRAHARASGHADPTAGETPIGRGTARKP